MNAWWSDQAGNMIWVIGGCTMGVVGALCGTLAALGRGRDVVLALAYGQIGLGVLSA